MNGFALLRKYMADPQVAQALSQIMDLSDDILGCGGMFDDKGNPFVWVAVREGSKFDCSVIPKTIQAPDRVLEVVVEYRPSAQLT